MVIVTSVVTTAIHLLAEVVSSCLRALGVDQVPLAGVQGL